MTDSPPGQQAAVPPGQQAAVPPGQQAAVPPGQQAAISPEWRNTTRRGAYATMTLALLLGYTWISATRDWGWPLLPTAVLLIAGVYVLLTTYVDRLPAVFGRDRIPVDQSTKYALWFDGIWNTWYIDADDSNKLDLRVALEFTNGGNETIQTRAERLDLEIDGIDHVSRTTAVLGFRLLPSRSKRFFSPPAFGLPSESIVSGIIRYAIIYGPPTGFPSYRRTHAISFSMNRLVTPEMVTNNRFDGVVTDWFDLEPEEDEDLQ